MHRRFFVLRAASEHGPARLEYYENEKKFRSKSPVPKKVLNLETCFNINKRADSKNKHMIVLYTRSESFAIAADSEEIQNEWYQAMLDLQCNCKTLQVWCDFHCMSLHQAHPAPGCLFSTHTHTAIHLVPTAHQSDYLSRGGCPFHLNTSVQVMQFGPHVHVRVCKRANACMSACVCVRVCFSNHAMGGMCCTISPISLTTCGSFSLLQNMIRCTKKASSCNYI